MRKLSIWAMLGVLIAALGVAAAPPAHAQRDNMGYLRIMHASPDAPAVDVWLDGQPAVQGLGFSQFTGHVMVAPGSHRIAVTPAGQGVDQAVINSTMDVAAGQAYTVMALGNLNDIRAAVFTDEANPSSPIQTDARMRVIHAVSGAPPVDLLRANAEGLFNQPAVVTDVEYGAGSGYVNVNAGAANLRIEPVNTDNVLATFPNATFAQDGVYTLVVLPGQGGQGVQAVWMWDKIGSAG